MFKTQLLLASMLVALAIGAVTATSASAASFLLESGTTAELAEEPTLKKNVLLEATGEPTIECSKLQMEHGIVTNGSPILKIASIRFDGCKDKSEAGCEVVTLKTKEVKDTLEETEKVEDDTVEKFAPASGKEILSFTLKKKGAETCSHTEKLLLVGDFVSKPEENGGDEGSHALGFGVTSSSKELEYGDQLLPAILEFVLAWRLLQSIGWALR
jgi:hypothetical protein